MFCTWILSPTIADWYLQVWMFCTWILPRLLRLAIVFGTSFTSFFFFIHFFLLKLFNNKKIFRWMINLETGIVCTSAPNWCTILGYIIFYIISSHLSHPSFLCCSTQSIKFLLYYLLHHRALKSTTCIHSSFFYNITQHHYYYTTTTILLLFMCSLLDFRELKMVETDRLQVQGR